MLNWLTGAHKVDHPLADARSARKIIDDFPYKDPWKTLADAGFWLGSVNETDAYKVERRFEVISLLDMATRKIQERLLDEYLQLPDTDHLQEKRTWKAATDFWHLLSESYLICVQQALDTPSTPGSFKAQLPVLAARATRALRHQMKWVLMRYGVVRAGLWHDLARCAKLAEAASVVDKPVELYPGAAASSQCFEFLRAMMLWASSPSGLSPVEQDVAERLVAHFTPKFRYDRKQWDGCDYCFDLVEARPPLRFMRTTQVSPSTRFFDVHEARSAVQTLQALVASSGNIPSTIDLGPVADSVMAARVLKHLNFNWAKEMPARAHERRRTAISLHVVNGYQQVLGAIEPALGEGLDFSSTLSHDQWIAEDASLGGYGVVVPAGKGEWLRVGVIIALRSEMDSSWSLGVIRRVKGDEHRQHRIGIQLISKAPVPVYLRSITGVEQGSRRQPSILLNTRTSSSGSMHIVTRHDLLTGREPIEARYGRPATTLVLEPGGIVESGYDFDWFRYKRVDPLL